MRVLLSLFFTVVYFKTNCHVAAQSNLNIETSNFRNIVSTSVFVDKTLFIKEFIVNNKTSLITAPPGFGKSTNLNMLRSFLEIEVNEIGQPITKSNYLIHPVKDTPNYKFFTDHGLKIITESKIMDEHFGRTPVMSVDFRYATPIRNFNDALKLFREAAHNTFKQHWYLSKSQHLNEAEREYFSMWCNDQEYHMFGKHRVNSCLRDLAGFLSRHFGDRRVLILVDNHDFLSKTSLLNVTSDAELEDIVRFSVCMIDYVLKNNQRYVWGGLITGVSLIPVFGSSDDKLEESDVIHVYRFLGDHPFIDFYGLTKNEVDSLLVNPKLKFKEDVIDAMSAQYGGYHTSSGKNIYNLYSTLKYLQNREMKCYWPKLNTIPNFSEVLKIPDINKYVGSLLRGEIINIEITLDKLTIDDILDYKKILLHPKSQSVAIAIKFFYLLLEEGYLILTNHPKKESEEQKHSVKIPNNEVMTAFTEYMRS